MTRWSARVSPRTTFGGKATARPSSRMRNVAVPAARAGAGNRMGAEDTAHLGRMAEACRTPASGRSLIGRLAADYRPRTVQSRPMSRTPSDDGALSRAEARRRARQVSRGEIAEDEAPEPAEEPPSRP